MQMQAAAAAGMAPFPYQIAPGYPPGMGMLPQGSFVVTAPPSTRLGCHRHRYVPKIHIVMLKDPVI